MKLKTSYKAILDSDIATYVLMGVIVVTLVIGTFKIVFG